MPGGQAGSPSRAGRRMGGGRGGAARPAPLAPGSGAWLQPGLTFQVSLAGDQSAEATYRSEPERAALPTPRGRLRGRGLGGPALSGSLRPHPAGRAPPVGEGISRHTKVIKPLPARVSAVGSELRNEGDAF